jgi:hypothetical protein
MNVAAVLNKNVVVVIVAVAVIPLAAVLDTVSCESEYKKVPYFSCLHLGSIFFIPKLNVFSKSCTQECPINFLK